MQSKNFNLRESYDPDRMEQVNLNDPDELEAQLELLDVVKSRRPASPKSSIDCKQCCCRLLIIAGILVPVVALILVDVLRSENGSSDISSSIHHLAEPPPHLANTCSEQSIFSKEGLQACKRACEASECCDFPANLALSCLSGNEHACLGYHASCHILRTNETTQQVEVPESIPPAPSDISDICKPQNLISHNGFSKCQAACDVATCCYESEVSPACTSNHDECKTYAPCLNMAATNHVHENIEDEIEAKCSSSMLQSLEGRSECRHACSHATCCFATEENPQIEDCVHENTDWCQQYLPCAAAITIPEDVEQTEVETDDTVEGGIEDVSQIRHACIDSLDPELCSSLCEPGECCFHHHGCDQSTHDMENCIVYAPCFVNYGVTDDDDILMTGDGTGGISSDALGIAEACHDSARTEIGQKCKQLCEVGKCCFETQQCDEFDSALNCDKYASCYVLYDNLELNSTWEDNANPVDKDLTLPLNTSDFSDNDESGVTRTAGSPTDSDPFDAHAEISKACRGSTVYEVEAQCEQICEPGRCCFVHHNCPPDNIPCERYASCFVVYGETDDDDVV